MNCLDCEFASIKDDTIRCRKSREVLTIADVYYITFCMSWKRGHDEVPRSEHGRYDGCDEENKLRF